MTKTIQLNAIDQHFADFIIRQEGAENLALWLAAALASNVSSQGHVCLEPAEYAGQRVVPFNRPGGELTIPPPTEWISAIQQCATIGRPGDFTPLILDESGRVYLLRAWRHEELLADNLLKRSVATPASPELLTGSLGRLFPAKDVSGDWQKAAAITALTHHMTIISGGPGTGKTHTVARILALLIEQAEQEGKEPLEICLAAPTGKAAMRLHQSITAACNRLDLTETVRQRMPAMVQTIHRLLGTIRNSPEFRHNASNPLQCDLLVVDEISMVDLPLMSRLVAALRPEARLILLGDADQLSSVEAGAIMADICSFFGQLRPANDLARLLERECGIPAATTVPKNGACGSPLVQLKTSYRFNDQSGIGHLSRLINDGQGEAAMQLLQSNHYSDLSWQPLPAEQDFKRLFSTAARDGFRPYMNAQSADQALDQLERFRILSPLREGLYGINSLNRIAATALGLSPRNDSWFCEQIPLMISSNNYELDLYNGDTAVILKDSNASRPSAFFRNADATIRKVSEQRLPGHEPALAMTVHKSQGSELERILLILPEKDAEVLTRELLYTAITRARSHIEIWCNADIFCKTAERQTTRHSGLCARLQSLSNERNQ